MVENLVEIVEEKKEVEVEAEDKEEVEDKEAAEDKEAVEEKVEAEDKGEEVGEVKAVERLEMKVVETEVEAKVVKAAKAREADQDQEAVKELNLLLLAKLGQGTAQVK